MYKRQGLTKVNYNVNFVNTPKVGTVNITKAWDGDVPDTPVSYTHLDVYKRQTIEIAKKIKNQYNVEPVVHLTCLCYNKAEIDEFTSCLLYTSRCV